jgi:hypothetical protein
MAKQAVWVTPEEAEVLLGFAGQVLGESSVETNPYIIDLFQNIYQQLEEID